MNQFAHFQTEIDELNIYFIHECGKGKNPIPLLLTHGFPDSIYRFKKLIPLLTEEKDGVSFDVIAPSIPGYGFSERPSKKGMTGAKIAGLFHELMKDKLGYEKYAAHGGDFGSSITEALALAHAKSLFGIHITDVPFGHIFQKTKDLSVAENKYFADIEQWQQSEGAYAMMQSTKPQTAAYGLNDSPVGLAAWIIEKFQSWSDGDLEKAYTKDELLTNITIYWATQTIGSSFLYYYEPSNGHTPKNMQKKVKAPVGFALFTKDLGDPPRDFAERFFNVQHWTEMPRGGHFAALEEPELLAEDIRTFFRGLNKK